MPSNDSNAALYNASGQMLSTAANIYATTANNKKQRKYQDEVYSKTRKDNLSDWDAQNFYNSPAEQMSRFKDAGLNPNLIYGQGNSGSSGGSIEGGTITSDNFQPTPTISNPVQGFFNTQQSRIQNRATEAQIHLLKSQELKVSSDTDTSEYNLGQKKALQEINTGILMEKANQEVSTSGIKSQQHSQEINKTLMSSYDTIERQFGGNLQAMKKEMHDASISLIKSKVKTEEQNQTVKKFEIEYAKLLKEYAGSGGPAFKIALTSLIKFILK